MKTTAILAATLAAFLFTGAPTFAAETGAVKSQTQTQPKRCYRTVHKLPYRHRVKCPTVKVYMSEAASPAMRQVQPPQQLAQGKQT